MKLKYIIKNNLPESDDADVSVIKLWCNKELSRKEAQRLFFQIVKALTNYSVKVFFRKEKEKPMRGQIQVEVDGFYYYVELFKVNN